MKRKISLILSTVAMLAVLSYCAHRLLTAIAAASAPTCGTEPVTLNAYFETGFDLPFKLSEEFTKQYPNVTWDISRISSRTSSTRRRACSRATTRPT